MNVVSAIQWTNYLPWVNRYIYGLHQVLLYELIIHSSVWGICASLKELSNIFNKKLVPLWTVMRSCLLDNELRISLKRTGLRQRVDRRMLVKMHAALFSNVRLLAMSEHSIRSATLTVVVTGGHPSRY